MNISDDKLHEGSSKILQEATRKKTLYTHIYVLYGQVQRTARFRFGKQMPRNMHEVVSSEVYYF